MRCLSGRRCVGGNDVGGVDSHCTATPKLSATRAPTVIAGDFLSKFLTAFADIAVSFPHLALTPPPLLRRGGGAWGGGGGSTSEG